MRTSRLRLVVLRSATICAFAAGWADAQTIGPFSAQTVAGWQYSISASGSTNNNLRLDDQQPIAGFSARVGGRVARLWHGPNDRLAASVGGSIGRLPIPGAENQNSYDVALTADHTFSPKLSGRFDASARSDIITRGFNGSRDGALLQGLVRARTITGGVSLAQRHTRTLTSQFSATRLQVVAQGDSGLDGRLTAVNGELAKRFSQYTTIGVGLAYQRSSIGGVAVDLPQLTVRSDQRFGTRFALQLSGAAALGGSARASVGAQSNGGATVSFQDGWGALSLSARRTVGQEFGRETPTLQIGDVVGLVFTRNFAKALQFSARTANGHTRGVNASSREVRSFEASTGLGFTPRAGLTIGAGAFLLRRFDRVVVASRGVSASISFDRTQLRMAQVPPAAQ